jgi:hypothetical protein
MQRGWFEFVRLYNFAQESVCVNDQGALCVNDLGAGTDIATGQVVHQGHHLIIGTWGR